MRIIYEGRDITQSVRVSACEARDTCGNRCDSAMIEFENSAAWFSWQPMVDDTIEIEHEGYRTGKLYLNTVLPEDGKFRILATALPCRARKRQYRSFSGRTIDEIMRDCGMATGMDYAAYGIDRNAVIPYIQQENECASAFLNRLFIWESAVLKCVNGKYTAIGIEWARARRAYRTFEIAADQEGTQYVRRGEKTRCVNVKTPYAKGSATDSTVSAALETVTEDVPARNDIQAARWARGILTHRNRKWEKLTIETEFDAEFTAMARIDVTGGTDADGQWLIDEAEHDFIAEKSRAVLLR